MLYFHYSHREVSKDFQQFRKPQELLFSHSSYFSDTGTNEKSSIEILERSNAGPKDAVTLGYGRDLALLVINLRDEKHDGVDDSISIKLWKCTDVEQRELNRCKD